MASLSGFFLALPDGRTVTQELLISQQEASSARAQIAYSEKIENSKQWERYTLTTQDYLAEDITPSTPGPPYHYSLICARSRNRVILLSQQKKIAEYVLDRVLARNVFPNLQRVGFKVGEILKQFSTKNKQYTFTSVHGRAPAGDGNVRNMSLYGDSVTSSVVFQAHQQLFNFTSCGIGRGEENHSSHYERKREIVRLGTDASVTIVSFNLAVAREAATLIQLVVASGWVDNAVIGEGDEI